ncbi:MAG: hypothetical protein ACJA2M_001454 [Polaribacter sp.]|jgi:hypothetical protein
MNLLDTIEKIKSFDEEAVLYVKRIREEWTVDSEVRVLVLEEEDRELKTQMIAEKFCPGFEYFLEVFIIKDWIEELGDQVLDIDVVKRIIQYAENDA